MKRNYILLLGIIFAVTTLVASPVKKYGKTLTLKEKTKISDILANPEKYDGKKVLVEGSIVDVCKMRGCWIQIASDKDFQSLEFKVEDGVMTFPITAKGKKVRAEGIISVETVTKEELIEEGKERAKEKGETFDETKVKEGETNIRLMGIGAEVK